MTMLTCRIDLPTATALEYGSHLFPMLEQLFPLCFVRDCPESDVAGAVGFAPSSADAVMNNGTVPSFTAPLPNDGSDDNERVSIQVTFSDTSDVPVPFRGRRIATKVARGWHSFQVRENEAILATSDQRPIWTMFRSRAAHHFRSALPLPTVTADTCFNELFNGERFLEMLPLIHFLRQISGPELFNRPPLRATYIIDDPNLHWPRYGFVDYRRIAERAKKENYHVSFATIPLDTWLTNAATARTFRENARWISLLVHGNNHAKEELARRYSRASCTALLQQAISRIEHLEHKAQLSVSRVMVPPHGACSSEMLAHLPHCGFDSACISTGSLRFYNADKAWTKSLGFFPSEVIEGCPVLPRWGLTGNVENNLLLAGYLGQPMILRGHHHDFRRGPGRFDELAAFINGMGDVHWSDTAGLARLNFTWRLNAGTCRLKPLGLNILFLPPAGATELIIDDLDDEKVPWQAVLPNGTVHSLMAGEPLPLFRSNGSPVPLSRKRLRWTEPMSKPLRPNPALVVRRLLTEARDRLLAV